MLEFDGTNAYTLPPSGDLVLDANGNAFAFGGWIKVEDISSRRQQRIFDFGNNIGIGDGVVLNFHLLSGYVDYGSYAHAITTSDTFPLHRWVHIAVIHVGGVATIYWDNVIKSSGLIPQPSQAMRHNNYIGMSNWAVDQPIAAGTQMHDLTWYNSASITIEQIRTRSGCKPVHSAGLQTAPVTIHFTGPNGWLALNGTQSAADSSQSLSVAKAFDGDATTTLRTCCGATQWVQYALPSVQYVDRYYLLASDGGCPSGWQFQAQQCEYAQAFPYRPYLPSCEWVTLDTRHGERCNNHTDVDPATFDIAKDQQRGATRYRWLFSGAGTLTELGMGSSAMREGEQEPDMNGHHRRQAQEAQLSAQGPPPNCDEVATEVAQLVVLVQDQQALLTTQQTMIAQLKQEQKQSMKAQQERMDTMKEALLVAIARGFATEKAHQLEADE
jgi:hypothetical protein